MSRSVEDRVDYWEVPSHLCNGDIGWVLEQNRTQAIGYEHSVSQSYKVR
jgi:hypothetical protein